ncbi:SIR2 family protein [Anaerobacillus sp. CMMVII]|uniref:SIR2 family NAD-dependent protein deacylase n=1 Tax=Anaerobacillus sp. CMMVII TaxID=2755588 RepID=UPI0021B71F0A|nr:SIR2 family protein [Anaerobacillus sp. CMMVII]MCT8138595.1 SIR2 family protein [Anaerobacillus sp. CMMVII]
MGRDELSDVFEKITKSLRLPVIFAGSGLAKRYTTNSFDWKELLIKCISEYCDDPINKYKEYKEDVEHSMTFQEVNKFSVNEKIGTFVEKDFNKAYYRKEISSFTVEENQSPLKVYISKLLSDYQLNKDMNYEIELFKQLNQKMLTVITTNYDTFFEDIIFIKHEKIIGQNIFKKSELGTLMKIHGCVTRPETLILTGRDYEKFKKRRKVLSAKIINLFTENPVIFMGYSVSDENIKSILMDIFECLETEEDFKSFQERLVIIIYDNEVNDPVVGTHSMQIDGVSISMTKVTISDFAPLLEEMNKLRRITRLRDIQHIKDLVYEIVESSEGEKRKLVNLMSEDEEYDGDEVVVIIGKEEHVGDIGAKGIAAEDIYEDIVFNNLTIKKEKILMLSIPSLLKANSYLPINKYIKGSDINSISDERTLLIKEMTSEKLLTNTITKDLDHYIQTEYLSLNEIYEADLPKTKKLHYLVLRCIFGEVETHELRQFIEEHYFTMMKSKPDDTIIKKMIMILDMLENK